MSENTKIEWAEVSLSPWWGCTKVSTGCAHCYAEGIDNRFHGGDHWGKGKPRLPIAGFRQNALRLNRRAKREGRRIRVFPSMCDPFDPEVLIELVADFWEVVRLTPWIDWMVLTKRPEWWGERMSMIEDFSRDKSPVLSLDQCGVMTDAWVKGYPPVNVWIGTSVENQDAADKRIPHLLRIPAKVRFLSAEPLLGHVDIVKWIHPDGECPQCHQPIVVSRTSESCACCSEGPEETAIRDDLIRWVICGGESGPDARPMHTDWARSLRDQCDAAGVPFLLKQWGEWIGGKFDPRKSKMICQATADGYPHGKIFWTNPGEPTVHLWDAMDHYWVNASAKVGKKAAGRHLDGRIHHEFPEVHQ